MAIAYNISVDIPQVSGAPLMNLSEFTAKVQEYVSSLNIHVSIPSDGQVHKDGKYSKRLQHLREMSRKVTLTPEDIHNDKCGAITTERQA